MSTYRGRVLAVAPMKRAVLRRVLDALQDAPFDVARWTDALNATMDLCGASSAQLITFGHNRVPVLVAPGFSADDIATYVSLRGPDPSVNPGVAQIHLTPALQSVADYEYISDAERRMAPLYNEFFMPHDGHHASFGVLEHHEGFASVVNLFHGKRHGPITDEAKRMLGSLLPRYADAARLQIILEDKAAAVTALTLDTVNSCVFICKASGRLVAATRRAEAALSNGAAITSRGGRLCPRVSQFEAAFEAALRNAARHFPPPETTTLVITDGHGRPTRIDIAPMPSTRGAMTLRPLALVHLQQTSAAIRLDAALLRTAFGLTAAETAVAEALVNSLASAQIAKARGVSIETVNSQVKAVLTKCQCARRSELSAILGAFAIL